MTSITREFPFTAAEIIAAARDLEAARHRDRMLTLVRGRERGEFDPVSIAMRRARTLALLAARMTHVEHGIPVERRIEDEGGEREGRRLTNLVDERWAAYTLTPKGFTLTFGSFERGLNDPAVLYSTEEEAEAAALRMIGVD